LVTSESEETTNLHKYELEWDIFHILTPFIENNTNLRKIHLRSEGTSSMLSSLALALSDCKNKRLEGIHLHDIETGSDFGQLFASLTGYNNLLEIRVINCSIESKGSMALSALLQNPISKIHKLGLHDTTLDDDCITTLGIGLIRNNSVKSLSMVIDSKVSSAGWATFCEVLSHPSCTIENLYSRADLDDIGLNYLGDALDINTSLKYLDLSWNEPIPLEGLRGFVQCLRNPNSSLEQLDLNYCFIDDEGAIAMIREVHGNVSLKRLSLCGNNVTTRGLVVIFSSLLNGGLTLEVLNLLENDINLDELTEEDLRVLTRALCDKSSIDSTFCSNHTLHGIDLDMYDGEENWRNEILCDLLDIDSTICPTLHGIGLDIFCDENADKLLNEIVCDLWSSLEINRRTKCKEEAAREKILKHHFVGGENTSINVFARMPESVLPFAIEWIGRNSLGYSLMYQFVRQFPLVFGCVK